ncbi:hypothetical protein NST84_01390 [Paenibacillus sp. FSL R7-0345]|uniref:hypothetical protein n=1 Tax=Paenibacillus sp. FSL R7-0345 TaxID=2954535 RepID=UPI00315AEF73
MKYKVGVLVMAGLLLTASSGFAAVHYQSLKNKDGELTYQVKPVAEFPVQQEEVIQRLDYTRELGEQLLQDGTAAIIYVTAHNPEGVTDTRSKPVVYGDWSVLQAKLGGQETGLGLAEQLPDGYTFHSASARYEPIKPAPEEAAAITDKLRKQAEQSGKGYALLPVGLSDKLLTLTASYRKGEQEVTVQISKTAALPTMYVDEKVDFTAEKLTAGGTELIYTRYKGGNTLTWSAEIPGREEYLLYQLDEMSGQLFSKEEMVRLAEPLLK